MRIKRCNCDVILSDDEETDAFPSHLYLSMFPGSARSRCYYKPPISSAPKPTMRSARTDAQLPTVFTHTAHEASPLVVCAPRCSGFHGARIGGFVGSGAAR